MIEEYIFQIEQHSTIKPNSILEIGALDGRYSRQLQNHFNFPEDHISLVEPNPHLTAKLRLEFPNAKILDAALTDYASDSTNFNVVGSHKDYEVGCSSLSTRASNNWNNYIRSLHETISVRTITGDWLLDEIGKPVDLCIIDIEGQAFNALISFKHKLLDIKSLMIECEHEELFVNQKLYDDVQQILVNNNYRLMSFRFSYKNQSDSIWINERYVNFMM